MFQDENFDHVAYAPVFRLGGSLQGMLD